MKERGRQWSDIGERESGATAKIERVKERER